jgi:hypothetical protein
MNGLYLTTLTPSTEADFHRGRVKELQKWDIYLQNIKGEVKSVM